MPALVPIGTLARIAGNWFAVHCGSTPSTIPALTAFAAWQTKRGNRIELTEPRREFRWRSSITRHDRPDIPRPWRIHRLVRCYHRGVRILRCDPPAVPCAAAGSAFVGNVLSALQSALSRLLEALPQDFSSWERSSAAASKSCAADRVTRPRRAGRFVISPPPIPDPATPATA